MTFLELAEKVLQEEQIPLSSEEIWQFALKKGYNKNIDTKGKTPWASIAAEILCKQTR